MRARPGITRSGDAAAGARLDTEASLSTAPRARRGRSGEAASVAGRRLLFVSATGALTVSAAVAATSGWHAGVSAWLQFALLSALAAVSVLFPVRGRESAPRTATVFLVAAAIALPTGFAAFVALPACVAGAFRRRSTPFLFLHSTLAASLATMAAAAVAHATQEGATPARAATVAGAGLVYCATAAGFDAALARISRSGRLRPPSAEAVTGELVLASLGVVLATVWASDAWRIPIALVPLILAHRLQRLPTLEQQAVTDAKTGLLNMHAFGEALESALARSRAERRPLSLVVVDLDLLREINNAHGHLVGDAVIKGISDVLRQQIRRGDLAARFGGEEFVLALPDAPPDRALRIAERIREAVASRVYRGEPAGPATRATLSAGVAAFPRDATTARALVHAADLAVMAAKARGRNRVVDAADLARRAAARG